MQRKIKSNRLIALLMSLMMLLSVFPTSIFAESTATEYSEPVIVQGFEEPIESIDDFQPDAQALETSEEDIPEATSSTPSEPTYEDQSLVEPAENTPALEENNEVPSDALIDESTDEPRDNLGDELIDDQDDDLLTPIDNNLESYIAVNGHAYVTTVRSATVYSSVEMFDPVFTISQTDATLLVTEYITHSDYACVKTWFITEDGERINGYVSIDVLAETILDDEEIIQMTSILWSGLVNSDAGELYAFVAQGEHGNADNHTIDTSPTPEEIPPEDLQDEPNPTDEPSSTDEPTSIDEENASQATDDEATPLTDEQEQSEAEIIEDDDTTTAEIGTFVAVTKQTRAFMGVDESATDDYDGDLHLGVFVRDATVQVDTITCDNLDRNWYKVRYMYGDDYVDGTLKWTEYDSVYVLASETQHTTEQDFSITDYAFETVPTAPSLRFASPMPGFSLKNINASVPSLYAGQTGVYGSSGKDSDYLQIAKSSDHGTIYATPHYLDGYTVYCLEHNLPGPGENISGGGQQPKGPYVIVDIDSYMNTPGYSSVIYHQDTLHAIAWVLRHTYPFMALDRSDSDNETWSRVAGQFAIREVIKQMEGAQYVRSYWDLDNFYRASGQAPEVYLTYARWLAANGIARGNMTGNINVSNKSVSSSGSVYTGTVTLSTDADLMRISKSAGSITGYTAGEDSSYYYLNSGDTISVSSTLNDFTIVVESISSETEEANFLVGVPNVQIQKVLIPQYGTPNKMKSISISFEIPYGSISVTKKDATNGSVLAGAVFELLNSSGSVIQTRTTSADGVARFVDLKPGAYMIREKNAPEGYVLSTSNTQNVTVTAGNVSSVTFSNDRIQTKIKIMKKDQLTKESLAGAEFTITRLSAPAGDNGASVGKVVAVITTDANGFAETGWLEWGKYKVEESKVPEHFVNNYFTTTIEAYENGMAYTIDVENEPAKGYIKLTKTDRQNGNPIKGVQFDIYYNDQYGEGLAGSMVTDKDGIAVSPPLRKGKYIVKEHGETAGYVFEVVTLDATVKSDETTVLEATNRHVTILLKLFKRDVEEYDAKNPSVSTRGDGVLVGAEFQVLAGKDIVDRQGNVVYAKGEVVVESLKTAGDDASVITDELWPGLYEIVELVPPVGYQPSDKHILVDAQNAATQSKEAIITYEGVKTNKIMYGALAIQKILGDNKEHGGSIVETPEKGAEFEVYLKSAGSYENARAFERDYLTTNRYGRAKTKALPYGVYVLHQIVGTEGHALMEPMDFMIDGTEDMQDPPTLILTNEAILYRLRIVKKDAETGNTIALANTAFKVRDANGNDIKQTVTYPTLVEVDTFMTDSSGEVTLPETITWGQYFIEEVQSPDGYLICTEPVEIFVGHAGDTASDVHEVTVEVPNEPVKGNIVLEKKGLQLIGFETMTDAYGYEYQQPRYEEGFLEGAVFEVRAADDIVGKDGTQWYEKDELVDTITTTSTGANMSKTLPLGNYYLVEIEAPTGYVFDDTPYQADLVFQDNITAKVELQILAGNEYLPVQIKMQKEKEITEIMNHKDNTVQQVVSNAPGEGFVFGLYSSNDIHYSNGTLMADTLLATGTTDSDGNLTFAGYYPHGAYYIKELSAPKGWKLNPKQFEINLDPAMKAEDSNLIIVTLPEAVHDELIYTKITLTKTDITGEKAVSGALIEVKNSDDEVIYRAYTDENGLIPDIPVTPGTYTFREVLAPQGYALNEAILTFTVDEDGNVTGDTTIRDDYSRFSILKQDKSNLPMAGVEFALLKEDGSVLYTSLSDENGMVTFEMVPYGNYQIVETKPLPGYMKSDTKVQVTVDGYFINPSEPLATIVNQRIHIHGIKVDTSGNYLPDVEFSLINATTGEIVETVTSNEKGEFILSQFDYGDWIIRETKVPEGYSQMEDILLHVDESWTEPAVFTCVNIPNHYEFMKIDNERNPLSGVTFALEDTDGNTIRELVSGSDGIVYVTDLMPGRYVIREIEAPEGFTRTDEIIELIIDENYIVADELFCLFNYSTIQTGFELTMTPVMWVGAGLILAGSALAVVYGLKISKKRKKGKR